MSKNSTKKNLIPPDAKGKVFHSLSEMGKALGVSGPAEAEPKKKTCSKCGAVMTQVAGSNVWLCPGADKDGKACGKRAIASVRRGF